MNITSVINLNDYRRLKTLYGISKLLSSFDSKEVTLPKIFSLVSESFPLLTAIIIEHSDNAPESILWKSSQATEIQVKNAFTNAKDSYLYLTEFFSSNSNAFTQKDFGNNSLFKMNNKYISLPLIIDQYSPFGILQLEGYSKLNEKDLEFVSALADLLIVSLDRYYISNKEKENQRDEANKSRDAISHSRKKVENLESERDLREAFVSLLTHDLRTPLSIISGRAQHILRKPNDPELCLTSAQNIMKHVKRTGDMITNLLDANLIHSGYTIHIKRDLVLVNNLIEESLNELSTIYGKRFDFVNSNPIEVMLDQNGIRRIIENLCINAVKYGFKDTPILVSLEELEAEIVLSVQNQGEIIPLDEQEKIFKQFSRTTQVNRSKIVGWGIGLTLVKGIAEAHGGSVSIKSEEKFGTIFIVRLPKNDIQSCFTS